MRTKTVLTGLMCLALASTLYATELALETDEQRMLYGLGLILSQNLGTLDITAEELPLIQAGLADGTLGREPRVSMEKMGPQFQAMLRARTAGLNEKEKEAGSTYREEAAKEPGAVVRESGLIYRELSAGSGVAPTAANTVKLHYHGTLRDGKVFDSSRDRGTPATFSLGQVVPCFSEGLQQMKVGGKSKIVCPPELAYRDRGSPPYIRPGATITFELELLEIVE
jgi:FKBP-type peptidyl-prolyl cis-trans isomerase FkpA/FKBP-type peptidyl-prolyl cis-trans isomerase FklB